MRYIFYAPIPHQQWSVAHSIYTCYLIKSFPKKTSIGFSDFIQQSKDNRGTLNLFGLNRPVWHFLRMVC